MDKQVDYLSAVDMPPGHYVFYRRIRSLKGLCFEAWNSKTRTWEPNEKACDAFIGLDVYADPIEESEVLQIIEEST